MLIHPGTMATGHAESRSRARVTLPARLPTRLPTRCPAATSAALADLSIRACSGANSTTSSSTRTSGCLARHGRRASASNCTSWSSQAPRSSVRRRTVVRRRTRGVATRARRAAGHPSAERPRRRSRWPRPPGHARPRRGRPRRGGATVVTGPAEQERPARTRPALLGALASPAASTTGFPPLDGPSPSQSRTALRQGAVRHCDGFWRPLPPASAEGECGLRSRRDTRREA